MKKRILFLGFILMILSLQLSAQTLKNIHRHNQPVLHIPTHLIDKVETADVNGERVLKVIQLNGYVSQIPVSQIDSITHSEGQAVDPAQLGNLRTASVMGVVRDTGNAPVNMAIVRSAFSGEVTHTDANGVFFLNNITVYDKLGYITIEKPGYHKGSRSFLPLDEGSNRVNIELLPMALSGSFNSTSGGQITSGLLQLTFPANAIQLNGQPYTGTVNVYAQALDPTSPEMFDQMPGELLGGLNDSLSLLRSFGMASVELLDTNMHELLMKDSVSATLNFNIPNSLQAEAPDSIDWWSFNEILGYWKHEGVAQKQGNQYIGDASHFSWWNCDLPQNFNNFQGSVNTTGGSPVSDGMVQVVSPTLGTAVTYTNSDGVFSGRVPQNQTLNLNILLICNTTVTWDLAHSENITSGVDSIVGNYSASLDAYYTLTGTVINCQGQLVETGYVKVGNQLYLTDQGQFTIQTCSLGEQFIRGFDTSNPDSIKTSSLDTVQVAIEGTNAGELQACTHVFSLINDIDGNNYPVILIGNQWWMTENLKTTHFQDGSEIPYVIDDTLWTGSNTPAWCVNIAINTSDLLYGKMYNWYTVSDPRNVCPIGWHVPSLDEYVELLQLIDPDYNLANQWSLNAAIKMKTETGWSSYLTSPTNESGFSALPGGARIHDEQNNPTVAPFLFPGMSCEWWTSSQFIMVEEKAWEFEITSQDFTSLGGVSMKNGFYIRCIKY